MSARKPSPQLPRTLGLEWSAFRQFCTWVAQKLGGLPEALVATAKWNPPSIAPSSFESTTVRVPGARVGDPISVGFAANMIGGMVLSATMEAANEVVVTLYNFDASPQDFGEHALTVIVWRVA